ncbi:MAG TPA: TerB family tellurite resistance protein [Candidatus Krumholzibacteria bacterium]|nr:TerB family tellurite resistance protein [Candidatus Krumholzibacteria bacterium]
MGLFGTILGGVLGWTLGGPLGAMIGGALGSNIGVGFEGRAGHPGARTGPGAAFGPRPSARTAFDPVAAQQAFLTAVISLAAKVAKADGHVSEAEVRRFDAFLAGSLGMPPEERRIAARIFNQARDSDIPAEDFARQIRSILGHQPARMRDIVSLLASVAMADGGLDPAEERLIRSIARELGLGAREYDEAMAMFNPTASLDAAYATLGVEPTASDAEVKKAYRRLAKEYHPDLLASKGMSDDFKKFAEDKMKAINEAYAAVEKARGK